jgi:hypothetical protein
MSWESERNTTDTDLSKPLKEWKSPRPDLSLTFHLKQTTDCNLLDWPTSRAHGFAHPFFLE